MANGPTMMNGAPQETSKDFKGDVKVNNNPPTKDKLEKIADFPVLDANGKSHTFKSLYADNENGPRRVLMVFIRHFFCGNCQDYIRSLSAALPPSSLPSNPPTSIIIIGCGSPTLIPHYLSVTSCAYPIYADPTRRLYDRLGMTKTLSLGPQSPEYQTRSLWSMAVSSFIQEIRSGRKMLSGGDFRQVGGEFLFKEGKVTWCRRMRNTRDHAELPVIRQQLGLLDRKDEGAEKEISAPSPVRKRWSTAGLGSGIGRRLSNRRRSWAPKGSEREGKGSPTREAHAMQQLKEEEVVGVEGTKDTPEDALAKLEGKTLPPKRDNITLLQQNESIDTAMNGHTNAPSKQNGNIEQTMNGHMTMPSDVATLPPSTSASHPPPLPSSEKETPIPPPDETTWLNGHANGVVKHSPRPISIDGGKLGNGHALNGNSTTTTNGTVTA